MTNNIIKIQNKTIGQENPCFIIAEAGVNHNGDLKKAKELVDIAKWAGVDAVKFQTWITDELLTADVIQAEYQKENTGIIESQYSMLKKLELSQDDFRDLKKYADEKEIIFLSTPDEEKSADFLEELEVPLFKIGSGEVTNHQFIKIIAEKKKPIILSTGMSNIDEIRSALKIIYDAENYEVVLLHCTSEYPTALSDVNLNAMLTLKNEFQTIIGYSDHTIGILTSTVATAMGAKVIEKHFTYDKDAKGPDHSCSLSPNELKSLVDQIRQVEVIMGSKNKIPTITEIKNSAIVRKTIVARKNIKKGTKLTIDMVNMKRSNGTIIPSDFFKINGKIVNRDLNRDEPINYSDLNDA